MKTAATVVNLLVLTLVLINTAFATDNSDTLSVKTGIDEDGYIYANSNAVEFVSLDKKMEINYSTENVSPADFLEIIKNARDFKLTIDNCKYEIVEKGKLRIYSAKNSATSIILEDSRPVINFFKLMQSRADENSKSLKFKIDRVEQFKTTERDMTSFVKVFTVCFKVEKND